MNCGRNKDFCGTKDIVSTCHKKKKRERVLSCKQHAKRWWKQAHDFMQHCDRFSCATGNTKLSVHRMTSDMVFSLQCFSVYMTLGCLPCSQLSAVPSLCYQRLGLSLPT